ncbi:MAG: hypothetical protein Alpg2KO_31710 [Alphaproteobacteria bacterium]
MTGAGMMRLNYGLIGSGMMGQEHIRNIALLKDAKVVAAYEPDADMQAETRKLVPDIGFAQTLDDLIRDDRVNCLLIASPNHMHMAQVERIAEIRPLPLLVEKPLFTDVADAARIKGLHSRYPAPIWVAMEYRYMPPVAAFLDQLEDVTGGPIMLTIREHRFPFLEKVGDWNRFNRNSGGTFVEKCCHFFDLMRLALRSEPTRVSASIGQAVNHLEENYGGEVPDIDDHGYVIVDFDNGSRAMLELCMFAEGSKWQEEISAIGPLGKIEAKVPGPTRFWPDHLGAPPVPQLILSPRQPAGESITDIPVDPALLAAGDHNGSTFYQHQRFADVARAWHQGRNLMPDVTLTDGAKAVEMGMAAHQAARTGKVVSL